MPDVADTNLNLLRESTQNMNVEESYEFESYFIGALAVLVSRKDWREAINSAHRCWADAQSRRKS